MTRQVLSDEGMGKDKAAAAYRRGPRPGPRSTPRIAACPQKTPSASSATPRSCADAWREIAEQMQGAQKVAWADNAIKLAVDMTVAGINR